jgi:hypothetical protein
MPVEVLIGRSLAFCLHPAAAWRLMSPASRAVLVAIYFAAGYLGALGALLLL